MQFEIGKIYHSTERRNTLKFECLAIVAGYPVMREVNCPDYRPFVSSNSSQDWKEHKEPITVEGWVNVYDPPITPLKFFTSKEEAKRTAEKIGDLYRSIKYIDTIFVKGTSDENQQHALQQ